MNKLGYILFFLIIPLFLEAQGDNEFETIKRHPGFRVSGFGGPIMSFTQIGPDFAHMMGGGGGIIVGDFFFGGYGVGKTNQLFYKNEVTREHVMGFGHGGFWLGYTPFYNKAVHPVFHTQIGWGGITKRLKNWDQVYDEPDIEMDNVFVICPTVELEINFSRFFKLGGGVNYTFVYNTDGPYTFDDFKKPGIFVSFKFGWF
jgi:hypothetical protein